jgi:hypothetical protein
MITVSADLHVVQNRVYTFGWGYQLAKDHSWFVERSLSPETVDIDEEFSGRSRKHAAPRSVTPSLCFVWRSE